MKAIVISVKISYCGNPGGIIMLDLRKLSTCLWAWVSVSYSTGDKAWSLRQGGAWNCDFINLALQKTSLVKIEVEKLEPLTLGIYKDTHPAFF